MLADKRTFELLSYQELDTCLLIRGIVRSRELKKTIEFKVSKYLTDAEFKEVVTTQVSLTEKSEDLKRVLENKWYRKEIDVGN